MITSDFLESLLVSWQPYSGIKSPISPLWSFWQVLLFEPLDKPGEWFTPAVFKAKPSDSSFRRQIKKSSHPILDKKVNQV